MNRVQGRQSQVGTCDADAFVDETAKASGRSRTAVARDAQRGNAIAGKAGRVYGTSLDSGVELARAKLAA